MNTEFKMQEFGRMELGRQFYLAKPEGLPKNAYFTKIVSTKDINGNWFNATSAFGTPTFIQYDKRVWMK